MSESKRALKNYVQVWDGFQADSNSFRQRGRLNDFRVFRVRTHAERREIDCRIAKGDFLGWMDRDRVISAFGDDTILFAGVEVLRRENDLFYDFFNCIIAESFFSQRGRAEVTRGYLDLYGIPDFIVKPCDAIEGLLSLIEKYEEGNGNIFSACKWRAFPISPYRDILIEACQKANLPVEGNQSFLRSLAPYEKGKIVYHMDDGRAIRFVLTSYKDKAGKERYRETASVWECGLNGWVEVVDDGSYRHDFHDQISPALFPIVVLRDYVKRRSLKRRQSLSPLIKKYYPLLYKSIESDLGEE